MIHHDYLLRLIAEFMQTMSRISELRRGGDQAAATETVDHELHRLLELNREELLRLSTAELLARLLRSGTSLEARTRALFVVALLKESGDLALEAGQPGSARETHLQALRLLLQLPDDINAAEAPQFVPTVDALAFALADAPLPSEVQALLMCHHERHGEFARAEDSLFAILATEPSTPGMLEFGTGFYRRLLARTDESLIEGNLPRTEVREGFAEFQRRAVPMGSDLYC